MNRNKIACDCRKLTYGAIEDAVAAGISSFEELQAKTGCGKGCGRCADFLRHWVAELVEERQNQTPKEDN